MRDFFQIFVDAKNPKDLCRRLRLNISAKEQPFLKKSKDGTNKQEVADEIDYDNEIVQ